MISATRKHKDLIIEILTTSFANNKSVNYLISQNGSIRELMDYSFEICLLFGKIFISDDGKACALILYPELKKVMLKSIWLNFKLIIKGIGIRNVFKAFHREKRIIQIRPDERMCYLWFIGVEPKSQQFGLGKHLMEELINDCAVSGRPIYLETSTVENLPWYAKFGFEIYGHLDLDYRLFFLRLSKMKAAKLN
jgi:ribosomal protein S18 acetylase RimI-like enzyme